MHRLFLLLVLSSLSLHAAENKPPPVSIRLHAEGKETDSETFVTPLTLTNPPKKIFIRKVPIMTEKDIEAFFPFAAADGSIGCYFKLDAEGTNKLTQHTVEYRDTLVVALVNGRVASAMMVGKKITDGIMPIPSGFTPKEVVELQTKYPIMGKEKEFAQQKKTAQDALKKYKSQQPKPTPTPKP